MRFDGGDTRDLNELNRIIEFLELDTQEAEAELLVLQRDKSVNPVDVYIKADYVEHNYMRLATLVIRRHDVEKERDAKQEKENGK